MAIEAYSGLSEQQRTETRFTAAGKTYNLDHPGELTLSMRFKGVGASGANAQGWERNSYNFFRELAQTHPEYFSKKNLHRIEKHTVPRVDARFAESFPRYSQFKGQRMIHHHVGRDGQAVAIPSGMHTGQGEIHRVEDALGITQRAARFSGRCAEYCKTHHSYINRRSNEFSKTFRAQSAASAAQGAKRNAFSSVKGRGAKSESGGLKQAKTAGTAKNNAISRGTERKKTAALSHGGIQSRKTNAVSRLSGAYKASASVTARSSAKGASRSAAGGSKSKSASKSK